MDKWGKGTILRAQVKQPPFLSWLSLSWRPWAASSAGCFPLGHKLLSPGNPSPPLAISLHPVRFVPSSFTTHLSRGLEDSTSTPIVPHQPPESWLFPSWFSRSRERDQERIPGGFGSHRNCINSPSFRIRHGLINGTS